MPFTTHDGARSLIRIDDTWCLLVDHNKHVFRKASISSLSSPTSSHGFWVLMVSVPRRGDGGIAMETKAVERVMKETFRDKLTLCNIVKST
ncbi:unnamed protein product [Musa hybrid cultivar]